MSGKFSQFNIFAQCKKYNISLWQCPQFLFVVMGIVIAVSSVVFYAIGERYVSDPRIIALAVILVVMVFLIIAFVITHSFENLAEANRMKSEFVSIVSHQLRAPLTNLRWAAQFLLSEGFNFSNKEQGLEYLDIIKENSARMEGLIDNLLIITRLKEGKIGGRKTKFSLLNLATEVVSEYDSLIKASNLRVDLKAKENLPEVVADYSLIKIVVENLISNAIHYSHGGGLISIELKPLKKRIKFQVEDQGIGIPEEEKKYIFQKFFRARNATKAEIYGTGLGLFIVKLILDKVGGKIGFTSREGKGSTFYFTLPIENKKTTKR